MKLPAPGAPRIDVSCEELETLLEGARAALGETGYQKLQAAIRTLGYVTELLPGLCTVPDTEPVG